MSLHADKGSQLPDLSFEGLDLNHFDIDDLLWSDAEHTASISGYQLELAEPLSCPVPHFYPLDSPSFEIDENADIASCGVAWLEPCPTIERSPIHGLRGPLEVLVLEADGRLQRKVERLLSCLRCRAVVADDQERALQYLSNGVKFDLIITRHERGTGSFARRLRETITGERPPILGLTTTPYEPQDQDPPDFDCVLEIPLNKVKLANAINTFFPRGGVAALHTKDGSDSDCSWTAVDDEEEWQFAFKRHLKNFRDQDERVSLISPPLLSKQRRKIHAMAHLYRLSHTSLGCGKYKRVLVTKCRLLKPSSTLHRWNPSSAQWTQGQVDPRIITARAQMTASSDEIVCSWFVQSGLHAPNLLMREQTQLHMFFQEPFDAAIALETLHGTAPPWTSSAIDCDYTIFKDCPWSPWQVPLDFNAVLANRTSLTFQPQRPRSPSVFSATSSEDDALSESDWSSLRLYAKSSTSSTRPQSYSTQPTNPSTASLFTTSSSLQQDSDVSTHTKRKRRLPFNPAGYSCSFGCGKSFDHAGDCRKHEKIHEERCHLCDICGKAFLYPKDVRRHCQNVHSKETSSRARYWAQRAERRVV